MKSITSLLLALAIGAAAYAQSKPGDFAVKPLPAQSRMKTRAVARSARVAAPAPCSEDICSTTQPHSCVEVDYPETAWRTCISNQGRRGLTIGPTDLRRDPLGPWMRVLREASVAEIFVPYHSFTFRLYDMQQGSAASLLPMNDADTSGTLITLSGQHIPQVAAEVNDRGVAWLCKNTAQMVRRGEELVLFGVYDAQNYDFIIEYKLRDDGSIGFRLGATGFNNPYFPPLSTTDAHMHSVLWRVDVDLNGADGDSAKLLTHVENAGSLLAHDVEEPFNSGKEGVIEWDPKKFLTVAIEDETLNAHGHHIGYAIRTNPEGLSRHFGTFEKFTETDFAVTRFNQNERDLFFDTPHTRYFRPDEYLLGTGALFNFGVANGESINNTDLVLWHRASVHHDPHDEDHAPGDPDDLMTGITLVHWAGFDLEPRNLFDFNPLGGPSRENCQ